MDEATEKAIGERLVEVLGLHPVTKGVISGGVERVYLLKEGYDTKTALGVYRVVKRIIEGE